MKLFLTIIFSFFYLSSFAQINTETNSEPPGNNFSISDSSIVDTIIITGNNKTADFIILREMAIKPGTTLSTENVEYDKSRIYNLQLFNSVEMYFVPRDSGKVTLFIEVSERWYIYPFPIVGIKDRDWKKFYFGGGIIHTNFRGKNEKIYLLGTLGYEPSLFLFYHNPQIGFWKDLFLETSLGYREGKNKSPLAKGRDENFSEKITTAGITLGKRYGLYHNLWTNLKYEMIRLSENKSGRLLNPWEKDAFPIITLGYKYDTRDLIDYSMFGTLVNLTVSKFGLMQKNIEYWKFGIDYRRFIPITTGLTLAARSFTTISAGNNIPFYKHVFFGYTERIRGHYNKIYEGENIIGCSAELRFMLFEPRYFQIDFISIPEFNVWKFGIASAIFGDAGTVWFNNDPILMNNFKKGYGAGIHFILPYSIVFRVEYALNETKQGQFIFDISSSF